MLEREQHKAAVSILVAVLLLALPILGVHAWMAWTFPSYLSSRLGQDVVFAFAGCGLLALIVRWRLLRFASLPLALLAYLAWLFLVLGEGISYYLQADTFNARFFANLNFANLGTALQAFPVMIGGGLALFAVMVVVCGASLEWMRRTGRRSDAMVRHGPVLVALVILVLTVLGVDSTPRQLFTYLTRIQESEHFADTPQSRAFAALLDFHPVPPKRLVAAPGKNLVLIYLESIERIYWDPRVFPGLTPNLDRLRGEGLDFSGFETFSGTGYTIAGMFASQCGVPLFSSPFAGLDAVTGNDTDIATFHPKLACLGDVLRKAEYTQRYLGGAPIQFSNKGLFYRIHGYDEAFGLVQLEEQAHHTLAESGWGLYDSELFPIALAHYRELEAGRRPFSLSMITLDTHPPHGRASPGCPKYTPNTNSMLQAVHCTDYLVGKFIAALKKEPGWKNTVVVIMSDHLMMRNDAEPLYPEDYHRQPALLVLNAGQGVRPVRMYHMDVAPTLLDLLGVRTNATFIAGQDRSSPDSAGSELADSAVAEAVLRKALWSRVNEFKLCKKDTLIGWTPDGRFDVGGRELGMSYLGETQVGIRDDQALDFFIDNANAKLVIADESKRSPLLATRGNASVLTVRALPESERSIGLFAVDWLGRRGAHAHLADVQRLQGLTITSRRCGKLMAQVDAAPAGQSFDLSGQFKTMVAEPPTLPVTPKSIDFTQSGSDAFERGFGWLPPKSFGSWAIGSEATLGFHLPDGLCRGGKVRMQVDPYLPPSRPNLDAQVWVNGKLATTWHFKADGIFAKTKDGTSDNHEVLDVDAPINTQGTCGVRVDVRFTRPGASPPPYPKAEDPRPLQLRVLKMQGNPATGSG